TDDDLSTVAINDVSVNESAGTEVFTVTLTGAIQDALTVDYGTSNGSALSTIDYTTKTGTVTFPAGSASGATQSITITITSDVISEPTESYNVILSNVVFNGTITATISDPTGVGTITDDDASSVAINDMSVDESAGTAVFTVTLTGAIQDALTVDFATSDIDALNPSDYGTQTGTLTFAAGSINGATHTITISIADDLIAEPTETYNVTLSHLVYISTLPATISDASGLGTITDNDIADITLSGFTVTETNVIQSKNFIATMSKFAEKDVILTFHTSDGSATAGSDYTAQPGTSVTIPAGTTSVTISVDILGDLISELTEAYTGTVVLHTDNGQQITISSGTATATIIDDDIANLSITKTSSPDPVIVGNNLTYTITVVNLGSNIGSNINVADILPAGLTFVSANTATGSWTTPNWSIGALPVDGTATLTLVASVNGDVVPGTVITNTGTVSSTTTDPDHTNNSASVSNHVVPVVTCHGEETVCQNAQPFLMTQLGAFTPVTGTYTGTGTFSGPGITSNSFNPASIGVGTYTYTYTYVVNGYANTCTSTLTVDGANAITLAGQVKYWNSAETYMQSPFHTNVTGTTPPDYFYVALYESTDAINNENPLANAKTWTKVDLVNTEVIDEHGDWSVNKDMKSYFELNFPLNPTKQYYITVWDGGNVWQEFVNQATTTGNIYNPQLGSSYTWNSWGGVSALDALAMQYMINGNTQINGSPYSWKWIGNKSYGSDLNYGFYSNYIANVNTSNGITALDALTTQYRIAGLQPTFPNNTPNFRVAGRIVNTLPRMTFPVPDSLTKTPFTSGNIPDVVFTKSTATYTYFTTAISNYYKSNPINSAPFSIVKQTALGSPVGSCPEYGYINIYYAATGDVNASYIPPSPEFKAESPTVNLQYENELVAQKGEIVTIPVRIDRNATLGALTLGMKYRNDLIKVVEIPDYDVVNISHDEGFVRLAWANLMGRMVSADDVIVNIKAMVLTDIQPGTHLFELESMTEIGDIDARRMDDINLKTVTLTTQQVESADMFITNYPNPLTTKTTFTYSLPESGKVKLEVYDKLGKLINTLIDKDQIIGLHNLDVVDFDLAPGVYTYRLVLQGTTHEYSATKSMIVVRD
ncbi:MAG: Calx-beta domain-containing protein, partial [Bacteroidota bacterium]